MNRPVSDLQLMISGMEPVLNEGFYVYTSVPQGTDTSMVPCIATVREAEGLTLVVPERQALANGWSILFRCAGAGGNQLQRRCRGLS
ncbi:ACT domain-containing protein [Rhodoferax lacus]|uniref:ACT domain-containing protein n=1 Tax=Rhodoferax lacus TaxID=2184758 RepID=UPI002687ED78